MASQAMKVGEVSKNLKKIDKKNKKNKNKKVLAQKLQSCDPNSLEKVFKKKNRKTKHKNKEKLNKNVSEVQLIEKELPSPKNLDTVSSNWKNLLKNLPKEDEGPKPKAAFVRRNKNGQLITNQPTGDCKL